MIDEHKFGSFTIDGKKYLGDIKIVDKKVKYWDDRYRHKIESKDIQDLIEVKPEVIIIGTGNTGYLEIPSEIKNYILAKGIKILIKKNTEAVQDYNKLIKENKKVAAIFHSTC